MSRPARTCLFALAAATLAAWVAAGPLTPPAGPVASTFKTLTDVEPRIPLSAATTPGDADSVFRIVGGGSYYLTANLSVPAGKSGIEVAATGTSIDLNGFTISGLPGSLDGVAAGSTHRLTVQNGIITNVGGAGVSNNGFSNSFRDLKIIFCGADGLAAGSHSRVEACAVSDCSGSGIVAGIGTDVVDCHSGSNAANGFEIGQDSSAIRCHARGNVLAGFVLQGGRALARDCRADNDGGDGFSMNSGDTQVRDCLACGNGLGASIGAGVHSSSPGSVIEGNTVISNDTGILVDTASSAALVIRNRAHLNGVEFSIPAGNSAGPIVTSATIATNTNPNANFDQ